jgi:prepilin-type N-terminal cleavage/methylation domain-containing protein
MQRRQQHQHGSFLAAIPIRTAAGSAQSPLRLSGPTARGFTLVELLAVVAVIGILVAILLPAVQSAREAARRSRCSNQLKQIGVALQLYHSARETLPPGGVMYGPCCATKSYTNWAIEILPFLEEEVLYDRYQQRAFNEDSINTVVREAQVTTFFCPSEPIPPDPAPRDSGPGANLLWLPGSYKAMTGVATAGNWWGNYLKGSPTSAMRLRGPIHTVGNPGPSGRPELQLQPVRFRQIIDGLSKTIAVGERSIELPHGIVSHERRTAWAYSYGHYNKSAAHRDRRTFLRDYDACLTSSGPSGEHACKHGWSSFHPGGMHFVNCDGAAHFQTDDIDLDLFVAKATIAGDDDGYAPPNR